MAYIVDYVNTESTAGAASFALTMPTHQTNDVLVAVCTQDATGTHAMTGWTQIATTQTANSAVTQSVWYKKAAGSSETGTLTMGTPDGIVATVVCIRDVDPTTQVDVSAAYQSGTTATSQVSFSSQITTTTSDCLILYVIGKDGIANQSHSEPGIHFLVSADSGGSTATTSAAHAIAWYVQRAAGNAPTDSWVSVLSGVTTHFAIALRNKSGGVVPAYVDDSTLPGTTMVMGHHFSTLNNLTFGAPSLTNIGPSGSGKAVVSDAFAATADYGINPYSAALSTTPSATAATSAAGYQITFTNTHDLSNDFIVGTVIASTPKMANYNHGSVAQGGSYVAVADASDNYHSFQVLARDSKPNTEGRAVFSIQPNQTTSRYGYSSSAPTLSAVKKLLFLSNNPTATITLYIAEIHRARTHICAGGTSTNPVDTDGMEQIGKSFRVPLIQKTGAGGLLSYVPIQIGGGDAINFQIDAGALQFPKRYSTATKELNFQCGDGDIGISYAGKSGDVVKHTNSVVTSGSTYYWEIHTAATNAATWDFTGLTVVNANVTLRNVMTFDSMTFTSCPTIVASGCALTNSTISKVPTSNDTFTSNGSTTVDNCTINITNVSSGNRWCSVASPSIFTNSTFVGSGSTGHAIRITTAGTYSLVGNTFTGFGADGSNSAAIFNDSGGAVTINVSGGGNTPTIRNGASATTTVNNAKVFTVTNVIDGSEVRIYKQSDLTELGGAETVGASPSGLNNVTVAADADNAGRYKVTYSYNYTADTAVFVVVLHNNYQALRPSFTLKSTDSSLQITQQTDRQYANT